MHKLLLAGLFSATMLAMASAGPVQAMKPASNADMRGCLGLWVATGGCVRSGTCSPGPYGQGDVTNCTKYDDGSTCLGVIASNAENTTCQSGKGSGCYSTPNPVSPCVVYEVGTCETNPQNNSSYCDTALGNGKPVDVGTYNQCT